MEKKDQVGSSRIDFHAFTAKLQSQQESASLNAGSRPHTAQNINANINTPVEMDDRQWTVTFRQIAELRDHRDKIVEFIQQSKQGGIGTCKMFF